MITLSTIEYTPDETILSLNDEDNTYQIVVIHQTYIDHHNGVKENYFATQYNGPSNPVIESWLGELEQEANGDHPNLSKRLNQCILSQFGSLNRDHLHDDDVHVSITVLNDGYSIQWDDITMSLDSEAGVLSWMSPLTNTDHTIYAMQIGKTIESLLREIYPYDFEDVLEVAFNQTFECSLRTMFHYESLKKDVDIVVDIDHLAHLKPSSTEHHVEGILYV